VIFALAASVASGCDRNIAPYDPDEKPQQPDLARIFPAPEEEPGGAGLGGGSAPVDPAGPSATSAISATSATGRGGAAIRGTVHLAGDSGGAAAPPGAVLFVLARTAGATGGPPLAVVRIPEPEFPFDFEIGPDDVMIPTMRFEGAIALSARLDGDGNATTREAGDRATRAPVAASPGDAGVVLSLE
jgi:hypothetical protein